MGIKNSFFKNILNSNQRNIRMDPEFRDSFWSVGKVALFLILFISILMNIATSIDTSSQKRDYYEISQKLEETKQKYDELYDLYQELGVNNSILDQQYQKVYQDYLNAEQNYQNSLADYQAAQSELNMIDDNTGFSGHFYTVIDYETNFGGITKTKSIHTSYSTYFHYRLDLGHPSHSSPNPQVTADIIETYCTVSSGIQSLAQSLKSQCLNPNDDEEVINALLSFTQHKGDFSRSIKYILDGADDFAKYPWETIAEGNGDCEDKAILFSSLVVSLGYSAAIFIVPEHVLVGVNIASEPTHNTQQSTNWYIEIGGIKYWTCETTVSGWLIGDLPSEYQGETVFYTIIT